MSRRLYYLVLASLLLGACKPGPASVDAGAGPVATGNGGTSGGVGDAGSGDARVEFEAHYQAWTSWYQNEPHRDSSSKALTDHPDFAAIVAMGKRALPLVFEKMSQNHDVFMNVAAKKITGLNIWRVPPNDQIDPDPTKPGSPLAQGEWGASQLWLSWWAAHQDDPTWKP